MTARWLIPAAFRTRNGEIRRATYEHPALVRLAHWLAAIALIVMAGSGLQILRAFPAFGPKIPEHDVISLPAALALGGWLAGALRWHFTFMWVFAGAGLLYLTTQAITGRYRMVVFRVRDAPGVWPMVRHYFLFGPKPGLTEPYNPLQKLAYTSVILFGAVSVLTGLVLYKPAQFSTLAFVFGGYRLARVWHFAAMCALLAFVPGHLLMVALHGWNNFAAMLTGWNRKPEYLADATAVQGVAAAPAGSETTPDDQEKDREVTEDTTIPPGDADPRPAPSAGERNDNS